MIFVCKNCGKPFKARPSSNRRFCSSECYFIKWRQQHRQGIKKGEKRCSKCREIKAINQFYTNGVKGHHGWCKKCHCENECLRRRNNYETYRERYKSDLNFRAQSLIGAAEKRARRGAIPFDLDVGWMLKKLKFGKCEVTGIPFDFSGKFSAYTPSIDRKKSKGGYLKSNCRITLLALNIAIKQWGLETFLPIAQALVNIKEHYQ